MELTIERNYDFTPEWRNNKDEAKPVVLKMRMLTTGERDKLMGYDFGPDGTIHFKPDRQGMFLAAVTGVENLVVNGETVKTGREILAKPGMDALLAEVVANVISQNVKEDSKN